MNRDNTTALIVFVILLCVGLSAKNGHSGIDALRNEIVATVEKTRSDRRVGTPDSCEHNVWRIEGIGLYPIYDTTNMLNSDSLFFDKYIFGTEHSAIKGSLLLE